MGGLESPYYALLLLIFVHLGSRLLSGSVSRSDAVGLAAALIGLILVRAEGFWPIAVMFALMLRAFGVRLFTHSAIVPILVACCVLLFLFSYRYFWTGAVWPNPVYAKVGSLEEAIPVGLSYVWRYYDATPWGYVQFAALVFGVYRIAQFLWRGPSTLHTEHGGIEVMLAATIVVYHVFVVLVGGNWMEYFRFLAPTVPLSNVQVFVTLQGFLRRLPGDGIQPQSLKRPLQGLFLLIIGFLIMMQPRMTYANFAQNCSATLSLSAIADGWSGLKRHVIEGNCAHSRDWHELKPFMSEPLKHLVERAHGPLTAVSYQAGFFPYILRRMYPPEAISFVDSYGLAELAVAKLAARRNYFGHADGGRIDVALQGKSGALSEYLASRRPNLVYVLKADAEMRKNFSSLGFQLVWDRPGAVVFWRPAGAPGNG
jgi:hypothetical protein